jgi:hypothetical protein
MQAQRSRAKDDTAADRVELARIAREQAALGALTPATAEAVNAARAAVAVAEQVRIAECDKRGPKCRERETEEQVKRDSLVAVLANKAATDKAAKLESAAAAVRARLARAPPVQSANPLGAALEQLIGATAAAVTAWQQAIVAAVFELCLVGVMVIYELLGHPWHGRAALVRHPALGHLQHLRASALWLLRQLWINRATEPVTLLKAAEKAAADNGTVLSALSACNSVVTPFRMANGPAQALAQQIEGTKIAVGRALPCVALVANPSANEALKRSRGSVRAFVLERLRPDSGVTVEMKTLLHAYRSWCVEKALEPNDMAVFADEMRAVCAKAGIEIVTKASRIMCRNVRLAQP